MVDRVRRTLDVGPCQRDDAADAAAGKVAIVTGAGSGIGRASALRFAAEGALVVAADIRGPKVDETVALIAAEGGTAAACQANVADGADVERMVAFAVDTFGGLDALFNNAGTIRPGTAVSLSERGLGPRDGGQRALGVPRRQVRRAGAGRWRRRYFSRMRRPLPGAKSSHCSNACGKQLWSRLHVGVNERVVALSANSGMPVADVHRIVQQALPIGADIEHHRDHARRVDAARRRVDGQLADRDLDAADPPVADSQDLLGVGRKDQVDIVRARAEIGKASSMPPGWSIERYTPRGRRHS